MRSGDREEAQVRCGDGGGALEIATKPMCALEMVEKSRRAAVKWLKAPGALSSCCFGLRWLEGS